MGILKVRREESDPEEATGASWRRILLEIYRYSPNGYGDNEKFHEDSNSHALARKLKISGHELMLGIEFLKSHSLIKVITMTHKPRATIWGITDKGFEVSLDLLKFKSSHETNRGLLYFTSVLVITGIFDFLINSPKVSDNLAKLIPSDWTSSTFLGIYALSLVVIAYFALRESKSYNY